MTDKEKIRAYIEKLHKEHRGSEGDSIFRKALRTVLFYIDSLQEEPSLSNKQSVDEAMAEIERKAKLFTEANKGKTSEEILAEIRGEKPVSEELEEAANKYAIESYPDEPSIGQFGTGEYESYVNMSGQRECSVEDFKAGAEWQKEQFEKDYTNLCKGIATAKGLAVKMAYDKGMADAREEIIEWLRNHIRNYAFMVTDEFEGDIDVDTAINDLKQAIKDE